MKKLIAVAILMLGALVFTNGCMPASQQEVQTLTNMVKQIVPVVREVVSTSSEETRNKVEVVLGQVEEVNEAVATAEDPVEAIEKGWNATELWNPYYGYGALALSIFKLLQGRKEKTALKGNLASIENKYSAAKIGMDKFRNENPDKAAELYNDVGEARKAKKVA